MCVCVCVCVCVPAACSSGWVILWCGSATCDGGRLVTLYIATPFSWFTLTSMAPSPHPIFSSLTPPPPPSFSLRFFHFTLNHATLICSPHKQPLKYCATANQKKKHDEGENTIAACASLYFQYVALRSFLIAAVAERGCVCVTVCVTGLWRKQAAWPSSRLRQAERHRLSDRSDLFSGTAEHRLTNSLTLGYRETSRRGSERVNKRSVLTFFYPPRPISLSSAAAEAFLSFCVSCQPHKMSDMWPASKKGRSLFKACLFF